MAAEDALADGEEVTKFCCDCKHFIPRRVHATKSRPGCRRFREPINPITGYRVPRDPRRLREYSNGRVLCGPKAYGWEPKKSFLRSVVEAVKAMDFWNWPPPDGPQDPGGIR